MILLASARSDIIRYAHNDMIFASLAFTANKVCNITRASEYHCVAISFAVRQISL